MANLRGKYATQRFGLQEAIAKITQDQYNKAYGVRENELEREAEERRFREQLAAQERAARASGGGGGFGGGGGGGGPQLQTQGGPDYGALIRQSNPYSVFNVLRDANNAFFGGKASYGQLADWAQRQMGGQIGHGTAADLALRNMFLGTHLETGSGATINGQTRSQTAPVTGTRSTPSGRSGWIWNRR